DIVKKTLDKSGKKYLLAYSPEQMMTGYSISRIREYPKIVGGLSQEAADEACMFYKRFCKKVLKVRDTRTAEFVKVSQGIYRDANIALANELYMMCVEQGVDFWEVKDASKHQFCDIHTPGMVGGHCIPVYPWFLINTGKTQLIRLARKINDEMIEYYADKAKEIAGKGSNAGIIGLTYREGVRRCDYSRAHDLITALKQRGFEVFGADPCLSSDEVRKKFKIKPLKNTKDMDVIIVANKIDGLNLPKDKTIDIKNTLG
ncbi:MAG: nucleotide sugar dehydrogenase, partial [Candidatus Altiarchaeota archaeon]|nr:nucleotide sugar dehydrogenase [Candidatus Altiarchaeota archaeon]